MRKEVEASKQHAGRDFSGQDLSGQDMAGWDLTGADLSGANLSKANLSEATLVDANLRGALLKGVDLRHADLQGCKAETAEFQGGNLSHAVLNNGRFDGASLIECDLSHVQARAADFPNAELSRSNLVSADFSRSDMRQAKLYGTQVKHARFERTDLRGGHMAGMRGYEQAEWKNVDLRDVDLHGTYLARRFIADQNFIHEFRGRGAAAEATYFLWWLTSNCGRSISRWGLLTALIMVFFAKLYTWCAIDFGVNETWMSPYYFSVITLTSLGYGDVLPQTPSGQGLAMLEVTIGYVMLGGLLSIFSTKMARRAE